MPVGLGSLSGFLEKAKDITQNASAAFIEFFCMYN